MGQSTERLTKLAASMTSKVNEIESRRKDSVRDGLHQSQTLQQSGSMPIEEERTSSAFKQRPSGD